MAYKPISERKTGGDSKGSKPDKIIRDALLLELNRMDTHDGKKVKRVNRIVHKLVNCAIEGKVDAIREIFDRVEGKVAQRHEADDTFAEAVKAITVNFVAAQRD